MLEKDRKKSVSCTFDSFCKKVLKNEARNILRSYKRKNDKEVGLSGTIAESIFSFIPIEMSEIESDVFEVGDYRILVSEEELADALRALSESSRNIILLAYFMDMHDIEIANVLNMVRSTVQYQRTKSLKKMKIFLDEWYDEKRKTIKNT